MASNDPASTQNQPPANPALAALQAQLAGMDAKVKIQADQQALFTNALPQSAATPSSGAFTVTGNNPFPSQRMAYVELHKLAKKIAEAVAPKIDAAAPVLLYDQAEINSLVNYNAVTRVLSNLQTQVNALNSKFETQLHIQAQGLLTITQTGLSAPAHQVSLKASEVHAAPAAAMAKAFAPVLIPGMVLAGLKTASDIIGMFRMNTNIAYSSLSADDATLVAAVAGALAANEKHVYQPAVTPLWLTDGVSAFMDTMSGIQTTLANLQYLMGEDQVQIQQVSDALNAYISAGQASQVNHAKITAETDAGKLASLNANQVVLDRDSEAARQYVLELLNTDTEFPLDQIANKLKAEAEKFLKELAAFASLTTTVNTAFGSLQSALLAVPSTGAAAVTTILRAEKLMQLASQEKAVILLVKNSVLGGSVVTRVGPLRGGHLLFTGGAIVNYTLFDVDGKILASGLEIGESVAEEKSF